ncbi:MAG: cytochrome c oxidase subunit 4 [Thermoanaerobacterales bacterium]|nr:hypothetical protein [Thermoanaerobacterales bacterium]
MTDQAARPTEGPQGHELRQADDRKVPWRVFGAIGAILGVIALIYWGTSYEEAGVVMLVVAAVLGLWVGVYLWLQQREPAARIDAAVAAGDAIAAEGRAEPGTGEAEDGHYLPHASVWPFAIGVGAATLANGLVLGLWVIVPGAVLLVVGIAGFVRQTRHRD